MVMPGVVPLCVQSSCQKIEGRIGYGAGIEFVVQVAEDEVPGDQLMRHKLRRPDYVVALVSVAQLWLVCGLWPRGIVMCSRHALHLK